MRTKRALIAIALITTLVSSPQAFPAGKTSIDLKKAGRSATSIPNTILSGQGIPSKTVGIDGDFFIDIKNANLYGPKTKGAWKLATTLRIADTKEVVAPTAGADGARGNTGEQGLNGVNGTNGVDGLKGADGAKGPTGSPGANGAVGSPGANGAVGAPGIAGAKGDAGAAGVAGANGTNGTNGAKGDPGVAGSNGTNGVDGIDGAAGSQGVKGETGLTGSSGPQGGVGATGNQGTAGISNAQWVLLPSKALITTSSGRSIEIVSTFTLSINTNYLFDVVINGLIPIGNTEALYIGAAIDLCISGICTPIEKQISIANNSESYANSISSKQFGIRIMGAYANLADTPIFEVHIMIQTASTTLTSITFNGSALITKVGSIG